MITKKNGMYIYLGITLFLIVSLYIHIQTFQHPYFGVAGEKKEGLWLVARVEPGGKAEELGVMPGDRIISIDGETVDNRKEIRLSGKNSAAFLHDNAIVLEAKVDRSDIIKQLFSLSMESLLMGIGIFTYFRKPESHLIRQFFWVNTVLALIILTLYSTDLLLSDLILSACSIWLPFLIVLFFKQLIFKQSSILERVAPFVGLPLGVFTLYTACMIFKGVIPGWIREAVHFEFMAGLAVIVIMSAVYWAGFDKAGKNQLLILLSGTALSIMPYLLLYALPDILNLPYILAPEFALIGLVPLSATIMLILIKQRMIDIKVYIPKVMLHLLFFAAATLVYLYSLNLEWPPAVFILMLALFSIMHQTALKGINNKTQRRKEWVEQERLRLSIQLAEKKNVRDLLALIAGMIENMLDVEGVLLVWNGENHSIVFGTGVYGHIEEKLGPHKLEWGKIQRENTFGKVMVLGEDGFLGIGEKSNHTLFSKEELQLLDKIRSEAFQLLNNSRKLSSLQKSYQSVKKQNESFLRQVNKSTRMNSLLIEAQAAERTQVSYFLHDQVLQNLIFLSRDLEELYQLNKTNQKQIKLWLDCLYETQKDIRILCDQLHPHIVDRTGLKDSMLWLKRSLKDKTSMDIQISCLVEDEQIHSLLKTSVFRIIRELANNAVKHSGAQRLQIGLKNVEEMLLVEVRDNGKGFDMSFLDDEAMGGKHLGLLSIHQQVSHLGGRVDIESSLQKGTAIRIFLPMMPGGLIA